MDLSTRRPPRYSRMSQRVDEVWYRNSAAPQAFEPIDVDRLGLSGGSPVSSRPPQVMQHTENHVTLFAHSEYLKPKSFGLPASTSISFVLSTTQPSNVNLAGMAADLRTAIPYFRENVYRVLPNRVIDDCSLANMTGASWAERLLFVHRQI